MRVSAGRPSLFGLLAVGVDLSPEAIAWCRLHHGLTGLFFKQGRAEALPCADGSVDVVVNVESSHCYASVSRFLAEVARVLRPAGHLAFCDLRTSGGWLSLHRQFVASGLEVVKVEGINAPVVRALDIIYEARARHVDARVPRIWRRLFRDFAASKDTTLYSMLKNGRLQYKTVLARASHQIRAPSLGP